MKKYLIWAKKHGGAFYRPDSRGYTINPDIAGRFTEDEAKQCEVDTHGDCEALPEDSPVVAALRRQYLRDKSNAIRSCLETMTPKQVLEILPELVQERIDLQMRGGI